MAKQVKQWITVNGQHVPIFEGQSKQEAVNNALKHQKSVNDDIDKKEKQIADNKKEADKLNGKIKNHPFEGNSRQETLDTIRKNINSEVEEIAFCIDPKTGKIEETSAGGKEDVTLKKSSNMYTIHNHPSGNIGVSVNDLRHFIDNEHFAMEIVSGDRHTVLSTSVASDFEALYDNWVKSSSYGNNQKTTQWLTVNAGKYGFKFDYNKKYK